MEHQVWDWRWRPNLAHACSWRRCPLMSFTRWLGTFWSHPCRRRNANDMPSRFREILGSAGRSRFFSGFLPGWCTRQRWRQEEWRYCIVIHFTTRDRRAWRFIGTLSPGGRLAIPHLFTTSCIHGRKMRSRGTCDRRDGVFHAVALGHARPNTPWLSCRGCAYMW